MTLFFIAMILIIIVPDLYIFISLIAGHTATAWAVAWWLPTVVIMSLLLSMAGKYSLKRLRLFFLLFAGISVPKLAFALFYGIGQLLGFLQAGIIAGLVGVALILVAAIYGITLGWRRLKVDRRDLYYADLPQAYDGLRIVQFSDFHLGSYREGEPFVTHVVDTILAQQPHLVLFTGDLVNVDPREALPFTQQLKRIKAPLGVYSVSGNHDYNGSFQAIVDYERNTLGWNMLLNESRAIAPPAGGTTDTPIYLVGVENTSVHTFVSRGRLHDAMAHVPGGAFTILMTHDPNHWRHEVLPTTTVQLTLSGHTHAGQLKIGNWSPVQYNYREWGGLYNDAQHGLGGDGTRRLLVSLGLGGTNRFRLGATPEINLITLHRKS